MCGFFFQLDVSVCVCLYEMLIKKAPASLLFPTATYIVDKLALDIYPPTVCTWADAGEEVLLRK